MTTLSDLIERTRRHLMSGETRDERNRLTDAIAADATSFALDFTVNGLNRGATLAIGLEETYVWEVSGTTVTVERADGGSTAAAHDAGTLCFVNPKFSPFAIFKAINEELVDLSAHGLYRTARFDFTYSSGTDAYDMTSIADVLDVIEVRYDSADGSETWPLIPRDGWRFVRGMQTGEFASGMALQIVGYANSGSDVNVLYKAPFISLATLADDVETVSGLPATAHDIVPLGAAIRLLAGTEVSRNFLDQGSTRRADEVPPQARASQARMLADLRRERISAERARLYAKHPVRS